MPDETTILSRQANVKPLAILKAYEAVELIKEDPARAKCILALKAAGLSNREVLRELHNIGIQCTEAELSAILVNPEFLRELNRIVSLRAASLHEKLSTWEDDAISTLVSIMMDIDEDPRIRAQCAVELLKMKNGVKLITEMTGPRDLEALEEERKHLEEQLRKLKYGRVSAEIQPTPQDGAGMD